MRLLSSAIFTALLLASTPSGAAVHWVQAARTGRAASPERRWQFTSRFTGEVYDVRIYTPSAPPPPNGFPVIYVLDGGALFGSFREAAHTRANAGELDQAVIVGIEGADGAKGADRFYDYSAADFSTEEKTFVVDANVNARHGGAEQFFQTIEREIKPKLATLVKVDPARTTLFGWSLGGQFVLHTLFRHPGAYRTFEALSPSIWWHDSAILQDVPGFFETLSHNDLKPRLFIGAGGREQDTPINAGDRDFGLLKREMQHARMVDNARDLTRDLAARDADHRLTLSSQIFDGQTHNSVPWAALNTVLDFAIGRK